MIEKHANISIFVPHIGCKNDCSFCNQRSISGAVTAPSATDVHNICQKAINDLGERTKNAEIAFFGGSFTAIERNYMIELLSAANEYIGEGKFSGIRISTRPDAIDSEILELLKGYGVTSIELGAQSMIDSVLTLNRRGHTAQDVEIASALIKENRFSLGLQMMISLYGSTVEDDVKTAEKIFALKPDTLRIYPTVIIKGTYLEEVYNSGEYKPMAFEDAVQLCTELLILCKDENINVIRLGLHASETLEGDIVGGLYHPAFRELCENRVMRGMVCEQIYHSNDIALGDEIIIEVNPKDISKMIGQNRCNVEFLYSVKYKPTIKQNSEIPKGTVKVYKKNQ